jgi:hypothetical protein
VLNFTGRYRYRAPAALLAVAAFFVLVGMLLLLLLTLVILLAEEMSAPRPPDFFLDLDDVVVARSGLGARGDVASLLPGSLSGGRKHSG